jgi:hypothetical protein
MTFVLFLLQAGVGRDQALDALLQLECFTSRALATRWQPDEPQADAIAF